MCCKVWIETSLFCTTDLWYWLKIKPFFQAHSSARLLIQVTLRGERTTMVLILLAHTAKASELWIKLFFFLRNIKRALSLLLFYCVHKGIYIRFSVLSLNWGRKKRNAKPLQRLWFRQSVSVSSDISQWSWWNVNQYFRFQYQFLWIIILIKP